MKLTKYDYDRRERSETVTSMGIFHRQDSITAAKIINFREIFLPPLLAAVLSCEEINSIRQILPSPIPVSRGKESSIPRDILVLFFFSFARLMRLLKIGHCKRRVFRLVRAATFDLSLCIRGRYRKTVLFFFFFLLFYVLKYVLKYSMQTFLMFYTCFWIGRASLTRNFSVSISSYRLRIFM